jgi:hypothetical protein
VTTALVALVALATAPGTSPLAARAVELLAPVEQDPALQAAPSADRTVRRSRYAAVTLVY